MDGFSGSEVVLFHAASFLSPHDSCECVGGQGEDHSELVDLFVDHFIDHFLEEDATTTGNRAKRLFSVMEVLFRALKMHGEQGAGVDATRRSKEKGLDVGENGDKGSLGNRNANNYNNHHGEGDDDDDDDARFSAQNDGMPLGEESRHANELHGTTSHVSTHGHDDRHHHPPPKKTHPDRHQDPKSSKVRVMVKSASSDQTV